MSVKKIVISVLLLFFSTSTIFAGQIRHVTHKKSYIAKSNVKSKKIKKRSNKAPQISLIKKKNQSLDNLISSLEQKISGLNKIYGQIVYVRSERTKMEANRNVLMEELAKNQMAFISRISTPPETKHNQAILLALSSKSIKDFVQGSMMINYVDQYLVQKNQQCSNLIRNIKHLNLCIASSIKQEQYLCSCWTKEKENVEKMKKSVDIKNKKR